MGYSPWGHKESDTTERLSLHTAETVGWTGELALGIYFHECLECGQLWVGLSSPTVPRSRIINQTS